MNLVNLFATLSLISTYAYLHIGIYTLGQNKTSLLNKVFFLLCLSFAVWSFHYSFAYISETPQAFSFWNKLSAFGWCTFSAFSLYTVLLLTENRFAGKKAIIALLFSPAAVFLFMALFLFGPGIETPAPVSAFFYTCNFLYNFSYNGAGIVLLTLWGIRGKSLRVKKQARLLVISCATPFLLNLLTQNILPLMGYGQVPFMGQIYSVIMVLGVYFVISRYKMLRIPENIIVEEMEKKIIELVILVNEKGELIRISNHVLKLLGYEGRELLGKNITWLFGEEDKRRFSPLSLRQEIEYSDIHIRKKNSQWLPVQIICVPILDRPFNEFLGTLLVIQDISKEYELRAINAELRERTIRDSLTHLYNHQHSLEILDREISRVSSASGQKALSIMMLDLDHFKRINDTFGHLYGDHVLKAVSEILTGNIDNRGYVGRFGGEEFIIILPGIGMEEAIPMGEKIRKDVQHFQYNAPAQDGAPRQGMGLAQITISIGVTQLEGETSLELLKKADDLLYQAKQNGRNRVEHRISSGIRQLAASSASLWQ